MTHTFTPGPKGRAAVAHSGKRSASKKRPHVNPEAVAKLARAAAKLPQAFMVMEGRGQERQCRPPFFDVRIMGHSVEWTDQLPAASTVYFASHNYPKELWRIDAAGNRTLMMRTNSVSATRV